MAALRPYGWVNDYDSIEIGNGGGDGLTTAERQTQLGLWALGSSPLIVGVDLTHLDPVDLGCLKNTAILAVDQDSIAAWRVLSAGDRQEFAKIEPNGDAIVGLFNTVGKAEKISISASAVGLPASQGGYSAENLWTGKAEKEIGAISATARRHEVVLYRVRAR
ncbi:MAG: hypothetical protein ACRD3F_05945 [Acidobacteriaceae bacterium]